MTTGTVKVRSFPDGAEIYMDSSPIRDTSGNVVKAPIIITDIPPGAHQVIFKMPGHYDEIKLVDVQEGAWSDVYATMRPLFPKT